MNICLIGNGLTNLVLAKVLLNKNIKVDLYYKIKKHRFSTLRTIGISPNNLNFLQNIGLNFKKIGWPTTSIKIYNETEQNNELLEFSHKNKINFFILKYKQVNEFIYKKLKKNKNFSLRISKNYLSILNKKKYDLIINSDSSGEIASNFFYKKIKKNYKSSAYTTIIEHNYLKNNIATQIFTKNGPIAFLPISKNKTSVVYSIYEKSNLNQIEKIKEMIHKYNKNYKIKKFDKFEKFDLKFSLSRNYFYKKILNFGDSLHKIHPLAGQGFNMTLRDIRILSNIIDENLDLGFGLDTNVLEKFQKETKHLNFIFASGIDFIHEFFKIDNNLNNDYSKKIFKILKKNRLFNKYSSNIADKGFPL